MNKPRRAFALLLIVVVAFFSYAFSRRQSLLPPSGDFIAQKNSPARYISSADAVLPPISRYKKILLVPLDSRPPCTSHVARAARLAGVEIVLPPPELLDYYTLPGEAEKIAAWAEKLLGDKAQGIDAAIVSLDQLTAGGLIASREKLLALADAERIAALLTHWKNIAPAVPLYAFSILPRHAPPPSIERYEERKAIMRYAFLSDKSSLGSADEQERSELADLESGIGSLADGAEIDAEHLARYAAIFPAHENFARAVARLTAGDTPTLDGFFIGQDDGEAFGFGNRERRNLLKSFAALTAGDCRLAIVRGADELALSIIARLVHADAIKNGAKPLSLAADFGRNEDEDAYFPYMAATLGETLGEAADFLQLSSTSEIAEFYQHPPKLVSRVSPPLKGGQEGGRRNLMSAGISSQREIANIQSVSPDILLCVHAGDNTAAALAARRQIARRLKLRLAENFAASVEEKRQEKTAAFLPPSLALVDLSRHFTADETILPLLVAENAPLNQLAAYAGWNTASNSIGTALAETVLLRLAQKAAAGDLASKAEISAVHKQPPKPVSRVSPPLKGGQDGERQILLNGMADGITPNGSGEQSRLTALAAISREILNAHFLEDNYYLKDAIDRINGAYFQAGFTNTGDLDLEKNYRYLAALLDRAIAERRNCLIQSAAWQRPFALPAAPPLYPSALAANAYFPWPRTFEINLQANFSLCSFPD